MSSGPPDSERQLRQSESRQKLVLLFKKKKISALLVLYRTITEILSTDNGSAHCGGCAINGFGLWDPACWIAGWNPVGGKDVSLVTVMYYQVQVSASG